jgi:hypothetical protein
VRHSRCLRRLRLRERFCPRLLARALPVALAAGCSVASPRTRPPRAVPDQGGARAIRFRAATTLGVAPECGGLQFRASAPPALRPTPLYELVVLVNGAVCHREGVPGSATVYGELAALCPAAVFEPGRSNLIEVALVPPGCSDDAALRAIARRRIRCAAPEPD